MASHKTWMILRMYGILAMVLLATACTRSGVEGGTEGGGLFESALQPDPGFQVGGIQMNESDQRKWVRALQESGMNTLEVTVYAQQGRWSDNNLWYYEDYPSVLEEIREARAIGLNVVMILRLQMDHSFDENSFLWHGMVFPETDYMLNRWFSEYGEFVKKWAEVCEEEGVGMLVIGSEMNMLFATREVDKIPELEEYYLNSSKQARYHKRMLAFSDSLIGDRLSVYGRPTYDDLGLYLEDESAQKKAWAEKVTFADSADPLKAINNRRNLLNWHWEELIEELREIYRGDLSIAANFDNYQEVGFWDKLDCIGINAYFPLRNLSHPSDSLELYEQSWDSIFAEIHRFKKRVEVPNHSIFFTELGYGRNAGATLLPWQGYGFSLLEDGADKDSLIIWANQEPFEVERNLAVEALYRSVKKNSSPLAGILYWKLTTNPSQLDYDPFALHVGLPTKDSLQGILRQFRDLELGNAKGNDLISNRLQ